MRCRPASGAASSQGQFAGLLLAGWLEQRHTLSAFRLRAALLLLAMPVALAPDPLVQVPRADLHSRPMQGGNAVIIGPQRALRLLTALCAVVFAALLLAL